MRFRHSQTTKIIEKVHVLFFVCLICLFYVNCHTYDTNPIIATSLATDDDTLSRIELSSIISDNSFIDKISGSSNN